MPSVGKVINRRDTETQRSGSLLKGARPLCPCVSVVNDFFWRTVFEAIVSILTIISFNGWLLASSHCAAQCSCTGGPCAHKCEGGAAFCRARAGIRQIAARAPVDRHRGSCAQLESDCAANRRTGRPPHADTIDSK